MAAQKFEFSDLVADEVRRVLAEQAVHTHSRGGGDLLDGVTLTDITKFISEISKLRGVIAEIRGEGAGGSMPAPAPAPALLPAPAPTLPAPIRPDPAAIYNSLLTGIEQLINVAGDMPLSEVKGYMVDHKGDVIKMIGEAMA